MVIPAGNASSIVSSREEAEGYVASICFKHGPPSRLGVELEWTVHQRADPSRPVATAELAAALGAHAPSTLTPDSTHLPLSHGSHVTVEPGGQVEISSPPHTSVSRLLSTVDDDIVALDDLLSAADLVRGHTGIDPHREPRRLLQVPRYAAMQSVFDGLGPDGAVMMCSTASAQVCLDAGEADDVATRWLASHSVGPAMVALFANSDRFSGCETGWASSRLRSTFGTCPPFTEPPLHDGDPAANWASLAMAAPVLCVRRGGECWDSPPGLTFGDWADGRHTTPPTYDDLDYHLSTLFPPVRAKGYLEVRYLDAQPSETWHHPVLLLSALMSDPATVDRAIEVTEQSADRWLDAARHGLDDEAVLEAASAIVELGCSAMSSLDVGPAEVDRVTEHLERRIADHSMRRHSA